MVYWTSLMCQSLPWGFLFFRSRQRCVWTDRYRFLDPTGQGACCFPLICWCGHRHDWWKHLGSHWLQLPTHVPEEGCCLQLLCSCIRWPHQQWPQFRTIHNHIQVVATIRMRLVRSVGMNKKSYTVKSRQCLLATSSNISKKHGKGVHHMLPWMSSWRMRVRTMSLWTTQTPSLTVYR